MSVNRPDGPPEDAAPFVFLTPAEHTRALPDLGAAFKAAQAAPEGNLRAQMFTGIATRSDLTAAAVKRLLSNRGPLTYGGGYAMLTALLNHPLLNRSPKLRDHVASYITSDAIPALIYGLNQPQQYLPALIGAVETHSLIRNPEQYLRGAFTTEEIDTATDTLVDQFLMALDETAAGTSNTVRVRLASNPLLGPAHLTRIIEHLAVTVSDPDAMPADNYNTYSHETVLRALLTRPDLTEEHYQRLMDALIAVLDTLAFPTGQSASTRLQHLLRDAPPLPDTALVRLLAHLPDGALAGSRGTPIVHMSTPVLSAAIGAGAPLTLLACYHCGAMTEPDAVIVVERISREITARTAPAAHILEALGALTSAIDLIGTPTWDRIYDLWCTVSAEPDSAAEDFTTIATRHAINLVDTSAVPTGYRYAAWASRNTDPRMRRHAVRYAYLPAMLTAAAADPSALVRAEVVAHPDVTPDLLERLARDPAATVRAAVAAHHHATHDLLIGLADDPDPRVRAVVNERFLTALTG